MGRLAFTLSQSILVTGIPRDRWSLIYMALVLCGVGFLLPYNSFITAVDFYQVCTFSLY